ncbi:MAG: hypothetical protein ACTSRP_07235 [Candidatus Helarchaeota archaeon]
MRKKKFFKRQDEEYKKLKKEKLKKRRVNEKLSPEEIKARKRAQKSLLFKRKISKEKRV